MKSGNFHLTCLRHEFSNVSLKKRGMCVSTAIWKLFIRWRQQYVKKVQVTWSLDQAFKPVQGIFWSHKKTIYPSNTSALLSKIRQKSTFTITSRRLGTLASMITFWMAVLSMRQYLGSKPWSGQLFFSLAADLIVLQANTWMEKGSRLLVRLISMRSSG